MNLLDIFYIRRRPFGLFPIEVRLIQIRSSSDLTQSQFNKMIFRNLNEYSTGVSNISSMARRNIFSHFHSPNCQRSGSPPSEPTKSQAISFHQIDFPRQSKTPHFSLFLKSMLFPLLLFFLDDMVECRTGFSEEKAITFAFAIIAVHR